VTTPPITLPSGVRDYLPRAAAQRRTLADAMLAVFERAGFARIITPIFEHADVLERGLGSGGKAQAIRFVEPGTGMIVALRPDITPQVARVVATRMTPIEATIRLCYEGSVIRLAGERGQHEIMQAGIEMIDANDAIDLVARDAEVLTVAAACLAATGIGETRLDVGHVAPATYVLAHAPDDRLATALSKKDRAGVRAAARALPAEVAPLAEGLATLWGPAEPTLARARALPWPKTVLAAIDHVAATLARVTTPASVDFSDLRGFDYYTGLRFAGFVGGAPDAVLRGGRYDELLGRYGAPARATGFALDLEAVAEATKESACRS